MYYIEEFDMWVGLNLLVVDGVVWCMVDLDENCEVFLLVSN